MQRIDKAIIDVSDIICNNISAFKANERGLLSQNILGQIRNFVEYVAIKVYSKGNDLDPYKYKNNVDALKYVRGIGKLRFLHRFHELLQKSVSHYTFDADGSERLMLKYYEYLLKTKTFLKDTFNLDVLGNLSEFPLNNDTELYEYYEKIAEVIDCPSRFSYLVEYNERYYIQKVKPFFINDKVYYEVIFTAATASASKFDRVIAFTNKEIMDNYAVKLSIHNEQIYMLNKKMSILIIDEYEVSIRPCELDNFSEIFCPREMYSTNSNEYIMLMKFLSTTNISLTELVSSETNFYNNIKKKVTSRSQVIKIFHLLDQCREIIINNYPGSNILRYLLYKMNNRVIKSQYSNIRCEGLSNLYFKYGCIPFDCMPFCTSLLNHNPRIYDLLNCIPTDGREYEFLARFIKNNTEIEGKLFTPESEIKGFDNIDFLIKKYNTSLYSKHLGRKLIKYNHHIYIKEYAENSAKIIRKLLDLSSEGVTQYTSSVDSWLSKAAYSIDDEGKKSALRQMFEKSHVALVYGSAGTGKSTLINHIANFWGDNEKIFLANTHPAVDNLRRKVTVGNSKYYTIASFISNRNFITECDVLFVDECSTVSNNDMIKVLEKANFKLLVLVGDVYQIESIYFGNWFSIAKKFVPDTSVFELTSPYRTTNEELLQVWKNVRQLDKGILESLVRNEYVARLNESIFEHSNKDEIILCLNYDGLYGINNINRFLQNSNTNDGVIWGINTYKIGDPVLFNESNIFSPLIHNNSKGKIVGIYPENKKIRFDIELEEAINEIDALNYDFALVGKSSCGNSIISFNVNKYRSTDEDDDYSNSTVVPFQVAYAVSIHKAQGLEYDSVKVVITRESEERITHNIFYTAITRAKKYLKIYWSPETEKYVLDHLEIKNVKKDAYLLSQLFSINMMN